jgi:hypothetical protein
VQLDWAVNDIQRDPGSSEEEKASSMAAAAPHLAQKRAFTNRFQEPDNSPKIMRGGQMVPMTPGINYGDNGEVGILNLTPDGPKVEYRPPTKQAESPYNKLATPQEKEQYHRDHFVGDYDAFIARGGFGEVDEKGGIKWHEPKEDRGTAQLYKVLTTPDEDGTMPVSDPARAMSLVMGFNKGERLLDVTTRLNAMQSNLSRKLPKVEEYQQLLIDTATTLGDSFGTDDFAPLRRQLATISAALNAQQRATEVGPVYSGQEPFVERPPLTDNQRRIAELEQQAEERRRELEQKATEKRETISRIEREARELRRIQELERELRGAPSSIWTGRGGP